MRILFLSTILFISCPNFVLSQKIFIYEMTSKSNNKFISEFYSLDRNEDISVFRSEIEKKSDSLIQNGKYGYQSNQNLPLQIYIVKDLKESTITKKIRTRFNDIYDISITEKINWNIKNETKKVGEFQAKKAIGEYGGRNWIGWYTEEIPIPDGPYVFCKLPGLILEIEDDAKDYSFKLIEIKNSSLFIKSRKTGIPLSFEQFKDKMKIYYNDPYIDLKQRNMWPIYKDDGHGKNVAIDGREATLEMQKKLKDNNNPIEINHKIEY